MGPTEEAICLLGRILPRGSSKDQPRVQFSIQTQPKAIERGPNCFRLKSGFDRNCFVIIFIQFYGRNVFFFFRNYGPKLDHRKDAQF